MKLNVYSVRDAIRGAEIRLGFSETDGAFCRDSVPIDIRSRDNPAGLPFNDVAYYQIAEYDTQTHKFINIEERQLDILKSYQFKVEKEIERVDDKKEKPLAKKVEDENIKNL